MPFTRQRQRLQRKARNRRISAAQSDNQQQPYGSGWRPRRARPQKKSGDNSNQQAAGHIDGKNAERPMAQFSRDNCRKQMPQNRSNAAAKANTCQSEQGSIHPPTLPPIPSVCRDAGCVRALQNTPLSLASPVPAFAGINSGRGPCACPSASEHGQGCWVPDHVRDSDGCWPAPPQFHHRRSSHPRRHPRAAPRAASSPPLTSPPSSSPGLPPGGSTTAAHPTPSSSSGLTRGSAGRPHAR